MSFLFFSLYRSRRSSILNSFASKSNRFVVLICLVPITPRPRPPPRLYSLSEYASASSSQKKYSKLSNPTVATFQKIAEAVPCDITVFFGRGSTADSVPALRVAVLPPCCDVNVTYIVTKMSSILSHFTSCHHFGGWVSCEILRVHY